MEKVKQELNTLNKLGFDAEYVENIKIPADNVLGAIKFKEDYICNWIEENYE